MSKIVVFGNSGSGKSTLAKKLCAAQSMAHLDLDTLAWKPTTPPERESLLTSEVKIAEFIDSNSAWVIEGCYADLLELVVPFADELIFMNLSVEQCVENARRRPWEPHKYESKAAQDENLEMLVEWIQQYTVRYDTFSQDAHRRIYDEFSATKRMVVSNE